MLRRAFIKQAAGAMLLASAPVFGAKPSYSKAFESALKKHKKLLGWQGLSHDLPLHYEAWQGNLPKQLQGMSLYRNGPGRHELGGQRYNHWFDGDGFISQFKLGQEGVVHQGKFIRTKKYIDESKAGRFLYNGGGSEIDGAIAVRGPEAMNAANISLLPVENELWAMWEAASPYRVDQESLETLGQVELSGDLKGVPFSAHPHQDPDGSLWNFGDISFMGEAAMVVYKLNAKGKLLDFKRVPLPRTGYVHDFALTDRYLIFYLPPLVMEGHGETYVGSFKWRSDLAGQLVVIDKSSLELVRNVEMQEGFIFHFGNSWQQGNELIINACWYQNADIMMKEMANRLAYLDKSIPASMASQIRLDMVTGKVELRSLDMPFEFVQYDKRFTARPSKYQTGIGSKHSDTDYNCISRINTDSGKLQQYAFSAATLVEEPLFVLKQGAKREGQGYLLNTWLDYERAVTGFSVFDAEQLEDGPLATMVLPYHLPLGFHGTIV